MNRPYDEHDFVRLVRDAFPELRDELYDAGVTVPPATIERMRKASAESKEAGVAEGIAIALDVFKA